MTLLERPHGAPPHEQGAEGQPQASQTRTAPAGVATCAGAPTAVSVVQITTADLPLACPPLGRSVCFDHPRIYLEILETDEALCPYCGTLYRLKPEEHFNDSLFFGGRDLHEHRRAF